MLGELDAAVTHLKQCIRVQPDHPQCGEEAKRMLTIQSKRNTANQLFKANQFWESGKRNYLKMDFFFFFFTRTTNKFRRFVRRLKLQSQFLITLWN